MSLVVSQSAGAGTESTLLETSRSIMRLWIQQSINILITGRVASGILIIKSTVSRWTGGWTIDIISLNWLGSLILWDSWTFLFLIIIFGLLIIVLFVKFDFSEMLDGFLLDFSNS